MCERSGPMTAAFPGLSFLPVAPVPAFPGVCRMWQSWHWVAVAGSPVLYGDSLHSSYVRSIGRPEIGWVTLWHMPQNSERAYRPSVFVRCAGETALSNGPRFSEENVVSNAAFPIPFGVTVWQKSQNTPCRDTGPSFSPVAGGTSPRNTPTGEWHFMQNPTAGGPTSSTTISKNFRKIPSSADWECSDPSHWEKMAGWHAAHRFGSLKSLSSVAAAGSGENATSSTAQRSAGRSSVRRV